jgi:hypothetical protein
LLVPVPDFPELLCQTAVWTEAVVVISVSAPESTAAVVARADDSTDDEDREEGRVPAQVSLGSLF